MSDRPVFVFAATYATRDDALADYLTLIELHAAKMVGTYDVAVISKDDEGKVHVEKHEKPTQHGAWGGSPSARCRVVFPPSISGPPPSAASSGASEGTCARASSATT